MPEKTENAAQNELAADTGDKNLTNKKKISPAILFSLIVVCITFLILVINILSDRHTPHTDQARVKGLLLPIAPLVSGYVTNINVQLHSKVNFGDTLLTIDQRPYKITVAAAESGLESALQSVDAGSSAITSATARVSRAKVHLERSKRNWERVQRVIAENVGALSQADIDRSEASYLDAIEQLRSAEADLQRQKDALGPLNENNPGIKAAINQLEKAQFDLENTAVIATSDGMIESFNVEPGYFAGAGQPLFSIVDNEVIWVQANLKENNLSKARIGNKVEIIFDIEPGKVFNGAISSIAYGVTSDATNPAGLPQVSSSQGWLRDPQRFPVIIAISNEEIKDKLRQGGQAEIVVYTGDKSFLNWLAHLRIKIMSKLSYVR